jgi:prespore-specific regulator
VKGRQWSTEEDQLLSETVLHTISQGGTQLTAFADVGKKVGRTAGACGFRWNAVLRGENPSSYSEAKKKRVYTQLEKKRKEKVGTFAEAIGLLKKAEQSWAKQQKDLSQLIQTVAKVKQQIAVLKKENHGFQQEHSEVEWVQQEVKNRYNQLLQLIAKLKQDASMMDMVMLSRSRTDGKTESDTSS